jgi:hypothetical protein
MDRPHQRDRRPAHHDAEHGDEVMGCDKASHTHDFVAGVRRSPTLADFVRV